MENNLNRIKIAYLSVNDPLDKRSWSGITYYLGRTLQKNVGEVDFLGPVKFPWILKKTLRAIAKFNRVVLKSKYVTKYSLLQNIYASRVLEKKIHNKQYDCIVAPSAAPELGYFRTDIPIVYVGDATYHLLSNYYTQDPSQDFYNLDRCSRWEGNHLERRSLQKCSLLIYSSHWAARSAISDYQVSGERVTVMPFGANMDFIPDQDTIFKKEDNKTLTLLYLAVEWERKGGKIAYDALQHLQQKYNVPAKLIVCGCTPPAEFTHPSVEVIPFLNKNKPEDHKRFIDLLSSVHFLILPTRADCSLLVACESNAYGVPAISTRTGGVADVVKDGINGYCLSYESGGADYADLINELFSDKERYHKLISSSRTQFEKELNWDKWAERFKELFQEHLRE